MTFWLVFSGCGSAVLAAAFRGQTIGLVPGVFGIRFNCINHGIRRGAYFRRSFQPGRHIRIMGGAFGEDIGYIIAGVIGSIIAAAVAVRNCQR